MADLRTETITDVEVMRIGVWHGQGCPKTGCKVTGQHLDEMVEAHKVIGDALDFPVKLGHDPKQKLIQKDGLPAAGFITNLRRIKDVLVADFKEVPGKIADLIRAGAFKQRSSEIRDGMEVDIDGKRQKFPTVLTAVALLGADLPAVTGLDDIKAMFDQLDIEYDEETKYSIFAATSAVEKFDQGEINSLIDGLMAKIKETSGGKLGALVLRQLGRALKDGIKESAAGKRLSGLYGSQVEAILSTAGADHGSKRTALAVLRDTAQELGDSDGTKFIEEAIMAFDEKALRAELGVGADADLLEAIKSLRTKVGTGGDPKLDERLTKLEADLTASQERVVTLETENAKAEAVAFADEHIRKTKILPAQKEEVVAMFIRDPASTRKFVEAQPNLIDTKTYGSESAEGDFASFEPTPEQIKFAQGLGNWPKAREGLMVQNAADKGVAIPASFFADKGKS